MLKDWEGWFLCLSQNQTDWWTFTASHFSSSSSSDLARVIGRSWKAALVECIQANVVWREVGWLMWSK